MEETRISLGAGCLDALGDHDREAGDVVGSQFDLAGVKPSADRDAESLGASADGSRASTARAGTVEGGHAAVARRLDEFAGAYSPRWRSTMVS